ncbi:contactin-2 [Paramuricea clavata]|uniref:Contactin-2 n=1 Tax=Paramuricea clavata TaxID=317549 RepID=A0A7D9HGU5_PARCT|nr:contactin-2 [Paramuricea clavata]
MEMAWGLFIKLKTFIYFTSLFLFTLNFKSGRCQLQIGKESADFDGRSNDFKSLYCSVAGHGEKTYEWYHNGNLVSPQYFSKGFISTNSDTLTVKARNVNRRYQGIYQLFVSSAFGRIFCRKIKVRFKVAGDFGSDSALPDIRQVVEGQPFRLSCPKHSYMRGCSYKWGGNSHAVGMRFVKEYRNRVILPDGTLFFSAITRQDMLDFGWKDGGYQCIMDCVFTGGFHSMTRSHKVGLNATGVNASSFGPKIITMIKDREVVLGSKYVYVTCAAAGSPTPSYRWAKIDAEDNAVDMIKTGDIEFGNFNHTMTIKNIDINHNGTYACIATSGDIYDMVKWKLIVREKPTWLSNEKIRSKEVDVFTNFTWECKAHGDPVPTYTWYSNASQMDTRSGRCEIDGGKISFSRVLLEDIGMYQCVAENGFGRIYQTVSLRVRARRPEFNKSSIDVVFLKDSQGTLRCQSNAIPRANYTWTKNGIPLTLGTKYNVNDGELLVINTLTEEDAGVYKCTAENVFGKAEQVINVTIGTLPTDAVQLCLAIRALRRVGKCQFSSKNVFQYLQVCTAT